MTSEPHGHCRTSLGQRFEPGRMIATNRTVVRAVPSGMPGELYLIWDEELEAECLLWVFPGGLAPFLRFRSELEYLVTRGRQAIHPHIARQYELLVGPDWMGVSFEAVDGVPLSAIRKDHAAPPFEIEEIAPWVGQTAEALHEAHEAGLLHRDLSPETIWRLRDGSVRVLHFGVSHCVRRALALAGMSGPSPAHAFQSPQAIDGNPPTPADDIYSLGAVVFFLLTGRAPFLGDDLLGQIRRNPAPSVSALRESSGGAAVPGNWEESVSRALAKNPDARPRTASLLASLLGVGRKIHAGELSPSRQSPRNGSPGRKPSASRRGRRLWRIMMAFTIFLLFLSAGVVLTVSEYEDSGQPKPVLEELPGEPSVQPEPSPASPAEMVQLRMPEPIPLSSPAVEPSPIRAAPQPSSEPVVNPDQPGSPVDLLAEQIPLVGASEAVPAATPSTPEEAPFDFENSIGMRFVKMGDLSISVWVTRVEDFDRFLGETKYRPSAWRDPAFRQAPDHPAVFVTWNDAIAFCDWLTTKERKAGKLPQGYRYRLPTDLEWSRVVGLPDEPGKTPDKRDMQNRELYPWGTQWPPPAGVGNYCGQENASSSALKDYDDGYPWTSPVGAFPANQYGLYDMGGNVWQWTMDWFDARQRTRTLRGGSWQDGALKLSLLSSCRSQGRPDAATDCWGFRVVIAKESETSGKAGSLGK